MARVVRTDFGTLGSVERTPQGGLRVPAALTRTGVLRYRDTAGQEWAELRPADEVFEASSLATLRGAPLTDLHPADMVTAESWKALTVGHVCDDVRADGELVLATVVVQDAGEVARVEAKERREVSAGYTCDLDETPGVYQGEGYHRVQRAIRYNHVALGPEGWGRAGPEVSLRMDGAAVQIQPAAPSARERSMKVLKVRGKEFRLDEGEADLGPIQQAIDEIATEASAVASPVEALRGKLSAMREALTASLAKVTELEATLGAAPAEAAPAEAEAPMDAAAPEQAPAPAAPAPITEDKVPEAVADAIAVKRAALWDDARKVLGASADLRSKKPREIHALVVRKALPTVKLDGLSDAELSGMFRAAVAGEPRNDALGAARASAEAPRTDGDEDPQAAMQARTANAWKTPLSKSVRS